MLDKFIKDLAEQRAKELFTKEFFLNCTDAWYGDEACEFRNHKVGTTGKRPSQKDVDKYMVYMQNLKDIYYDNFFSVENAVCAYSSIISRLKDVLENIDDFKKKYKEFECPAEITLKLKQAGNYFVNVHNELLPIYNARVKEFYPEDNNQ